MKKYFMVVAFSIILVSLNQGHSQPNWPILVHMDEEIIMQNAWIAVKIL